MAAPAPNAGSPWAGFLLAFVVGAAVCLALNTKTASELDAPIFVWAGLSFCGALIPAFLSRFAVFPLLSGLLGGALVCQFALVQVQLAADPNANELWPLTIFITVALITPGAFIGTVAGYWLRRFSRD
jgi:hypothetical protein